MDDWPRRPLHAHGPALICQTTPCQPTPIIHVKFQWKSPQCDTRWRSVFPQFLSLDDKAPAQGVSSSHPLSWTHHHGFVPALDSIGGNKLVYPPHHPPYELQMTFLHSKAIMCKFPLKPRPKPEPYRTAHTHTHTHTHSLSVQASHPPAA